ncbi:PorT family protein [Flavobacteriaceae bacterium]|nr:PorT family protein [Flavobacteriaceae bacterium]
MKKLFIITMTFAAFTLQAQDVTFGAKAGLNFASAAFDYPSGVQEPDLDSRTSIHFGITAEFAVSDTFSVQPELLYSSLGAKGDESYSYVGVFNDIDVSSETTLKLNYLLIPVMAKFYLSDALSLEAGPQLGFLMSAKTEGSYEETNSDTGEVEYSESGSVDRKDSYKSTDFALNFGVGYKLESGLNFGLRYSLGLTNLDDPEVDNYSTSSRNFQLSVGYNF